MAYIFPEDLLPGVPLTNFYDEGGGGGSDRGLYFILYTEFVYPKNHYLFLAYPKKSLSPFFATQKITLFFSRPKKIPAFFTDPPPKKSLLTKISGPNLSLGLPSFLPSLKYLSGVTGDLLFKCQVSIVIRIRNMAKNPRSLEGGGGFDPSPSSFWL